MKLKKKVLTTLCGISSALLLTMFPQTGFTTSWSYTSSITLPTVYSRNFTEIAYLPIVGSTPTTGSITQVSWVWSVAGWPANTQGLSVYLCHGDTNSCLDVSRIQRMTTTAFNNRDPAQQFFYALRVASGGTVPVSGQTGTVTVNWE
ncbi:flagellar protein FlhE [Photorhabdus akhurstii]|nr:flagellar protein FlhE [Photorhabdus akhurstii]MBS9427977.1 flagellar protein FlhE [Photorhabdus akhurstii]